MRKPIIAGNWKMNLNHLEAIAVTQKLSYSLDDKDYDAVDVVVIPPFTDIRSVQTLIDGDRLRHGYQQTQRPLGHPPRSPEKHRGLLSGNRARRPRRTTGRLPAPLQPRRHRETDPLPRRHHEQAGTGNRPRPAPPDRPLRRERRLPPRRTARLLRRKISSR